MIAIIGRGNVATHLYAALQTKKKVCIVNPHTLKELPEEAELYLICTVDSAIGEIASKLPQTDAIIAHTSGSVPMKELEGINKNIGVFYPLQTFTKEIKLNYKEIPVLIEGSSPEVIEKLKNIALLFSEDVRTADSETRKKLHLASVFACNFTNAMAGISLDILQNSNLDFSILHPLIKQTVSKLSFLSPSEAQTGPARRRDNKVIETHISMLQERPDLQELYKLMTNIIQHDKI